MNKIKTFGYAALVGLLTLSSCGNCKREPDKCVAVDMNGVNDKVELKLSNLLEDLDVVRLQSDKKDAYAKMRQVFPTQHYLGIKCQSEYKLFNRDGKYLGQIAKRGKGPGDYNLLYTSQVDEKNQRVYLMEYNATKILAYDFQGKFLKDEVIPLPVRIPKGRMVVDKSDNKVVVTAMPFQGSKDYSCWVQDLKGNIIQSVPAKGHTVSRDYSNEIYNNYNTNYNAFNLFQYYQTKQDSLYHYDSKNNVIKAVFTVNAPVKAGQYVTMYNELPNYYIYNFSDSKKTLPSKTILLDKKSGEAQLLDKFTNDFMGGLEIGGITLFFRMVNGYYADIVEPLALKMQLDKLLENGDLNKKDEQKLSDMVESLHENDNNIILVGKLKS